MFSYAAPFASFKLWIHSAVIVAAGVDPRCIGTAASAPGCGRSDRVFAARIPIRHGGAGSMGALAVDFGGLFAERAVVLASGD
jgi:hypothetical protein